MRQEICAGKPQRVAAQSPPYGVIAFTILLAAIAIVATGLAPALYVSSPNLTFTWALSGALSLTPFSFLRGTPAAQARREAVSGGRDRLDPVTVEKLQAAAREVSDSFVPKELDFRQFRGEPFFIAYQPPSLAEAAQTSPKHTSLGDFA